ncbi:Hemoglobin-binding protein C, partial [Dissostichus eleginoides]
RSPCSHEEADTRLFLHIICAVQNNYRRFMIRTADTDVVVIAVAAFNKIKPDAMWIAIGTGSSFRYIAVHEVVATMDPRSSNTLPVHHAFTGCDTVSAFAGRGKKTAWDTWKMFPEVTKSFEELLPREVSEPSMLLLERFVVLMYNRTSDIVEMNEARKQLLLRNQGLWRTSLEHELL